MLARISCMGSSWEQVILGGFFSRNSARQIFRKWQWTLPVKSQNSDVNHCEQTNDEDTSQPDQVIDLDVLNIVTRDEYEKWANMADVVAANHQVFKKIMGLRAVMNYANAGGNVKLISDVSAN